ncbi:MAG: glycosyltransferase family 1 protein [Rhizobiaceae bacterium]|nr:glycosyltransferase family 1 protein [Rhizobiaceae bacterium]
MRIMTVTDAWHPQINGVVRTTERLLERLDAWGNETSLIEPSQFSTFPLPSYPDIRLSLPRPGTVALRIAQADPDHVHIVTEGPLGLAARRVCLAQGRVFTTSYHTRFPEYLRTRVAFPVSWSYACLRRFHNAGTGTFVSTPSLASELRGRGFTKVRAWTRGVDTALFDPAHAGDLDLPRPIFLYVGRVAVEKDLPAFLDLDLPGTKLVVGDGPSLSALKARYPQVVFLGSRTGTELARLYASSDVFVFPSRTDTFGIVLLEALASGLPVAAYPVTGPADVLADGQGGVLSHDLREAALAALRIPRAACRQKALGYDWDQCARMFLDLVKTAYARDLQPDAASFPFRTAGRRPAL